MRLVDDDTLMDLVSSRKCLAVPEIDERRSTLRKDSCVYVVEGLPNVR